MNADEFGAGEVAASDASGIRQPRRQPIINAPSVVMVLCAVLIIVHVALQLASDKLANQIILALAFMPARFLSAPELGGVLLPGGEVTRVTSFVSYALLHGSWMHLFMNVIWMLAFGSVAARRLGASRFMILSMVAAAVAAMFSLVVGWGTDSILVGASGAISGQMAVAVRLIFAHGGTLTTGLRRDLSLVPPEPLAKLFTNPAALTFLAIWLGIDLISASSGLLTDARVAWEAHLGGFLAGLLMFGLVDPKKQFFN